MDENEYFQGLRPLLQHADELEDWDIPPVRQTLTRLIHDW